MRWKIVSPDNLVYEDEGKIMLASTKENDYSIAQFSLPEKVKDPQA